MSGSDRSLAATASSVSTSSSSSSADLSEIMTCRDSSSNCDCNGTSSVGRFLLSDAAMKGDGFPEAAMKGARSGDEDWKVDGSVCLGATVFLSIEDAVMSVRGGGDDIDSSCASEY